jgi:chromosome segregation ATPase
MSLLSGRGRIASYRAEIRRLRDEVEQLEGLVEQLEGLVSDQQAFIALMGSKIEALEARRDDGYVRTMGVYEQERQKTLAESNAARARASEAEEQVRRESKAYAPIEFETR